MRRLISAGAVGACLLIPASAMAGQNGTGVSTNATTSDAIGFCVSGGNYNRFLQGLTTGDDRSSFAGQPGAVAARVRDSRAYCAGVESPYPPPGSAR
jgi:hypothetical protein